MKNLSLKVLYTKVGNKFKNKENNEELDFKKFYEEMNKKLLNFK